MLVRAMLFWLGVLVLNAAAAQAPDWRKIRIGVEGSYPPFSMISAEGKLTGFDIELALALCQEMKAECSLVQQEWDGMIPAIKVKKFDAIVASMTITEERRRVLEFSDPYYDIPSRWIARSGVFSDTRTASLKGKRIAVIRNSPRAKYLAENYRDSELLLVNKEPEVYLELAAGRADIAFGSSVVSEEVFLKRPAGKGYAQVGEMVRLGGGSGVGIAVRKDDIVLRDRFNAALKSIKAKGVYRQVAAKYFDFDVSGDSH